MQEVGGSSPPSSTSPRPSRDAGFVVLASSHSKRVRRAAKVALGTVSLEDVGCGQSELGLQTAREWGRLAAAVASRGAQPRRRSIDLVIAATANAHRVPLFTHDTRDFAVIADLVDVRAP